MAVGEIQTYSIRIDSSAQRLSLFICNTRVWQVSPLGRFKPVWSVYSRHHWWNMKHYSTCKLSWASENTSSSFTFNKYGLDLPNICVTGAQVSSAQTSRAALFKVRASCPVIPHSSSIAFKHFMKLISFYACQPLGRDNALQGQWAQYVHAK